MNTKVSDSKIVISGHDSIVFLTFEEIIRCEASGSYTRIFVDDYSIIATKLLKVFEKQLTSKGFIRVHNSHLINANHILKYNKQQQNILMSDSITVPVSRRKKSRLMEYVKNLN